MNVGQLKEIIRDLPDEMPVQVYGMNDDDEIRTSPIIEIVTHEVENDDGEEIEILVIAF